MDFKPITKYAKASASFTSALLFGTESSDGLVKTLATSIAENSGEFLRGLVRAGNKSSSLSTTITDPDYDFMAPPGTDQDSPMNDPYSGRYYDAGGARTDDHDD